MADKKETKKEQASQSTKVKNKPEASPKVRKDGASKSASSGTTFEIEAGKPRSPVNPPRLKLHYEKQILPILMEKLSFKNKMEAPKLEKIVVSTCVPDALANPKILDYASSELAAITGQKPKITRAKKSIAAFKLRQGQALGAVVTLRRTRMYEFFDRLVNVALPRVRDFKGINPKSFDGRGNYSLGIKEQIIFPEINYDKVDKIRGMNITIATSAKNNTHAQTLLAELGMPFRKT